ncbi:MAG: hypothetical protein ACLFV7_08775 [Phycisphaerae bacterium]
MRIDGFDIPATLPTFKGRDIPRSADQAETPRGASRPASATPAVGGETVELATYSRSDLIARHMRQEDTQPRPTSPDDAVRMFSKLSGLWDDFREMGVFPPPKSYGGFKVITPTDVVTSDVNDTDGEENQLSAADEASIILIQHMLRQFAEQQEASDPAGDVPESPPPSSMVAEATAVLADGSSVDLRVRVDAAEASGEASEPAQVDGVVFHLPVEPGQLSQREYAFRIDLDRQAPGPDDAEGATMRIWSRDERGVESPVAFGRSGQGAVYERHASLGAASAPGIAHKPDATYRGRLSPYEQAALGSLGDLDLAV